MHIKKKRKRKHKWSIFCTLNYSLKWTRTINATIFQRLIVFAHDLWPQVQCWWLRLNLTSTLICIQTTKLIARLSVVCTKNFDLNWTKEGINDISQTDSDWWMTFDLIFFFFVKLLAWYWLAGLLLCPFVFIVHQRLHTLSSKCSNL